jgi:hypothetical protein
MTVRTVNAVRRLKEIAAGKSLARNKWYVVDVSKHPSNVVAGPFKNEDEAESHKKKQGWSDKKSGAITHEVMDGANCLAEGIDWK